MLHVTTFKYYLHNFTLTDFYHKITTNLSDNISFLPRDASINQARPLPSCGVCASVCLSRSWIM